jgi:hypothetical protein
MFWPAVTLGFDPTNWRLEPAATLGFDPANWRLESAATLGFDPARIEAGPPWAPVPLAPTSGAAAAATARRVAVNVFFIVGLLVCDLNVVADGRGRL